MTMRNKNLCVTLYLVICLFFFSHAHSTTSSGQHCLPDQSSALLQLKQEFEMGMSDSSSYSDTFYPKMKYWKANIDCCSWDGVTCNNKTGHVVGLDLSESWLYGPLNPNSSLFRLRHLQKLNLAFNNFNFSRIPSEIGQLVRLSHLNLCGSSFSGQLPSEISWLTNLLSIDLSLNFGYEDHPSLYLRRIDLEELVKNMTNLEELHLDEVDISSSLPQVLINLSSLTSLSLSGCSLSGKFPKNIFILPKIQDIDLSSNEFLTGVLPEFPYGSSLRQLILYDTNFAGKLPNSIGNLKSLNVLSLSSSNFSGQLPPSIGNLSQLTQLSFFWNHFHGHLPSTLGNLTKLTFMALVGNLLDGEIPSSLGNLAQLESLYLFNNDFSGMFPISLTNLTELTWLDISRNQLNGPIPSELSSISNLYHLDFSYNSLTGTIPSSLFKIPSLNDLGLEQNHFVGPLEFQNISSSNLAYLSLGGNKLNEPIPRSIVNLTNLEVLNLSSVNGKGILDLNIFFKLEKLTDLDLSGNNLSFTNEKINSTFPKFKILYLSSCNIREFFYFLEKQNELEELDLSNNRIEGKIPKWFWNVGINMLGSLHLSHNLLSSFEEPPIILPWKKMSYLDLRSNLLQGSLPIPPLSTKYFFASENKFTGRMPPTICKLSFLEVLDLSNNQLSGLIPQCLGNFSSSLSVLNLRMNEFQGSMPLTFTNESSLRTLDFSHNQIQGKIPRSLINCNKLEVLNLGNNIMNDTFPFWLDSLPQLKILVLRENRFHGPISCVATPFGFSKLRMIDLSHNNFIGKLPSKYFETWNAMSTILDEEKSKRKYVGDEYGYYEDSVTIMNKGVEMVYVKILTILTAIDLSNNKFQGEIPDSVGNLRALVVLNLSGNFFTGPIPSSLGNLVELESLDLSQNKFSEGIPQQLTSLTFLEYLNLSQNQLVGPIPQNAQFLTFSNSSFEGNLGLCGSPLSKKCENGVTPTPTPTSKHSHKSSFEEGLSWKVVMMGYACGLIVGLVIGHFITERKSDWFARTFKVSLRR